MMDNLEFFKTSLEAAEPMVVADAQAGLCILVGAYVVDADGRVFSQRRSKTRRFCPGYWDNVGGHVEAGETLHQALAREMMEETGWALDRILFCFGRRFWRDDRGQNVEYLVIATAQGNLTTPRLETDKVDKTAWITRHQIDTVLENGTAEDRDSQRRIFEHVFDLLKNLIDSGFVRSISRDGKVVVLEKDGARYIIRDAAKSTGGSTADFYRAGSGSIDVKIRLGQEVP